MTAALEPLIISLKPSFADLLFQGRKTVEFRRRIASQIQGREVFIYVSGPDSELRGGFRVGEVWAGTPDAVWTHVAELATLDKHEFDTYFKGKTVAYALEVTEVWEYREPIALRRLRSLFKNFVAPQSWRYARTEERRAFQRLKRRSGAGRTNGQTTTKIDKRHLGRQGCGE